MKNTKFLFLSVSVFTLSCLTYISQSYAADQLGQSDQLKINTENQIPDSQLPEGAYKTGNIESISASGVKEKELTVDEKSERFRTMTGQTPQEMGARLRASAQETGVVNNALQKSVTVGAKGEQYTGKTAVSAGNKSAYKYQSMNKISGADFLAGKRPDGTVEAVPTDTLQPVDLIADPKNAGGTVSSPTNGGTTPTSGGTIDTTLNPVDSLQPVKTGVDTVSPVGTTTTTEAVFSPVDTKTGTISTGTASTTTGTVDTTASKTDITSTRTTTTATKEVTADTSLSDTKSEVTVPSSIVVTPTRY